MRQKVDQLRAIVSCLIIQDTVMTLLNSPKIVLLLQKVVNKKRNKSAVSVYKAWTKTQRQFLKIGTRKLGCCSKSRI